VVAPTPVGAAALRQDPRHDTHHGPELVVTSPLDGVKVLDLSRVLAGPFAGRMLADLGADVVKVEPPEGDVTRTFGPNRPQTAYFRQQNAGKRSITVDFRTADGQATVKDLATVADVVLENFRPGVLDKFGLGWPDLSALNPRLVMLSISGFGQQGPERDRAAYAGVIHAETGLIARVPGQGDEPHADIPISMADTVTGLHGVIGILAALRHRDATGVGNHIDLAMMDALLSVDDYAPAALHARSGAAGRHGDGDGDVPQFGNCDIVDAPGGPLIVMGEFKWIWKSIHDRLGIADPTPPGADVATKVRLRRTVWRDLVASFTDRAELLATLDRANLAWGAVKTSREAAQSPTVLHRGTLADVTDADGTAYQVIRAPYRFSAADSGVRGPAPHQGEHEAEIRADWLGAIAD
jgi:CoA:oxalate CoA-transferase